MKTWCELAFDADQAIADFKDLDPHSSITNLKYHPSNLIKNMDDMKAKMPKGTGLIEAHAEMRAIAQATWPELKALQDIYGLQMPMDLFDIQTYLCNWYLAGKKTILVTKEEFNNLGKIKIDGRMANLPKTCVQFVFEESPGDLYDHEAKAFIPIRSIVYYAVEMRANSLLRGFTHDPKMVEQGLTAFGLAVAAFNDNLPTDDTWVECESWVGEEIDLSKQDYFKIKQKAEVITRHGHELDKYDFSGSTLSWGIQLLPRLATLIRSDNC